MKVSVIIPTYNRAETLSRAMDSVLSQDRLMELIVVDDGSTDKTQDILDSYAQNHDSIKFYSQENKGVSAARNLGLKHISGEWIAFLDSDDEWLPGKLSAQIDFFTQNPDYKICQTEELWIRNGKRVNPMKKHQKYGGWIFEKCLPLCIISPSAVMIRKSIFEEIGNFDESLPACEDYDLWLRIASRYPVGLIEKPFLKKYGGHEDQLSRKYIGMDKFRIQALVKVLKSEKLSEKQQEAVKKEIEQKYSVFSAGAKKHDNLDELQEIENLMNLK